MKNEDAIFTVCLVRNGNYFIYTFDAKNVEKAKNQLGKDAANPESDLTWLDATRLCKEIKRVTHG